MSKGRGGTETHGLLTSDIDSLPQYEMCDSLIALGGDNCVWNSFLWCLLQVLQNSDHRETKHHTQRVGELRFITLVGPQELTLTALSPKQRGYKVFIGNARHQTLVGSADY